MCVVAALSAQPRISFDKTECNVGDVLWKKPVTVTYTIINTGDEPLVIHDVDVSCGCLNPVWTKQPIRPKEFGTVSATYDARMLGTFHKSIGIFSNATEKPVYLAMTGKVCTEITDYSKDYPVQIGNFYLDKNHIEFPDVNRGDAPEAEIYLVNASDKEYEPVLMHLPAYLEAKAEPEVLQPKQVGRILLRLHTDKLPDLGLTRTSVYLARYPGDKVSDENEIDVMAVLLPDFSHLTAAHRVLAPKANLSKSKLHLKLNGKKKVSETIILTNNGRSTLNIDAMQVTAPSINVSMKKRSLRPGESMKVKVTAVADYLKSRKQTPRVLMITNDPERPKLEISVQIER